MVDISNFFLKAGAKVVGSIFGGGSDSREAPIPQAVKQPLPIRRGIPDVSADLPAGGASRPSPRLVSIPDYLALARQTLREGGGMVDPDKGTVSPKFGTQRV
jgi:hypothetical protein